MGHQVTCGYDQERKKVERAARKAASANTELALAMKTAHEYGLSLRNIAKAAGVSHTQVQRTIRSDQT